MTCGRRFGEVKRNDEALGTSEVGGRGGTIEGSVRYIYSTNEEAEGRRSTDSRIFGFVGFFIR
jgi:hypothetical protein